MSEWKYFTDDELACKCGECDGEMKPSFMFRLEELREFLGFPFPISSAYRCLDHNTKVGGSKNSYITTLVERHSRYVMLVILTF